MKLVIFNLILIVSILMIPCLRCFGEEKLHNERFGRIVTFGQKTSGSVAIFFPEPSNKNLKESLLLKELIRSGFFVISLDTEHYIKSIKKDSDDCNYLGGEIERLGQSVQKETGVSHFSRPFLVGEGAGADLAFAILAQTPDEPFRGLLTLDFSARISLTIPFCENGDFRSVITQTGLTLSPANITVPWVILQDRKESVAIEKFIVKIDNSEHYSVHSNPTAEADRSVMSAKIHNAIQNLKLKAGRSEAVDELPLEEIGTEKVSSEYEDYMALLISGDGGWARIDKELSFIISQHGMPVVGFNSLKFFWDKRTIDETASAISRVLDEYMDKWRKEKLLLFGFSMGADVLPLVFNRLPDNQKEKVQKVILLSPGLNIDLEVHIGNWIGVESGSKGLDILPEVLKITPKKLLCIYGTDERHDTICTKLDSKSFQVKGIEGSHHFDGKYNMVMDMVF